LRAALQAIDGAASVPGLSAFARRPAPAPQPTAQEHAEPEAPAQNDGPGAPSRDAPPEE
jgi:hypothetical protein